MEQNPAQGYLRVRAYAASQAVPISNLNIVVSKQIGDTNVIFFEGKTNESGVIDKIVLPAPRLDPNNMDVPNSVTYEIRATSETDNINQTYIIYIYENVYVVQNISIVPNNQVMSSGS